MWKDENAKGSAADNHLINFNDTETDAQRVVRFIERMERKQVGRALLLELMSAHESVDDSSRAFPASLSKAS